MNRYGELAKLVQGPARELVKDSGRCLVCPQQGGRVFAELASHSLHRIDLETVARPDRPFNNFGGANFWPAPEGGALGFNYQGDQWCVQPAINNQPFVIVQADDDSVRMQKEITLVNRKGTRVRTRMSREVRLLDQAPMLLHGVAMRACLGYRTIDQLEVLDDVSAERALMAAWTLEQFDATPHTVAFVAVARPEAAINFDYYQPPRERIHYRSRGFTYQVDGQSKGQIGIKVGSRASCIGFVDASRKLLCVRQNESRSEGRYFNIADNDQPGGPDSAADNYSIFNSDPEMAAFELETVGAARIEAGRLRGSELISTTTFALLEESSGLDTFLSLHLGE